NRMSTHFTSLSLISFSVFSDIVERPPRTGYVSGCLHQQSACTNKAILRKAILVPALFWPASGSTRPFPRRQPGRRGTNLVHTATEEHRYSAKEDDSPTLRVTTTS